MAFFHATTSLFVFNCKFSEKFIQVRIAFFVPLRWRLAVVGALFFVCFLFIFNSNDERCWKHKMGNILLLYPSFSIEKFGFRYCSVNVWRNRASCSLFNARWDVLCCSKHVLACLGKHLFCCFSAMLYTFIAYWFISEMVMVFSFARFFYPYSMWVCSWSD